MFGEIKVAHSFTQSLAASHAAEDLPFWLETYRAAFPGMIGMHNHRADGDHQRQGIDRSIVLDNSKQILIDEKVRWRNKKTGEVYSDIALEYLSDKQRNTPGWVCKPLLCDFIAYAIAPLGVCYLLPVLQLQQAWGIHGEKWIKQFPRIVADNEDFGNRWKTVSVGVPHKEVFRAIGNCHRIAFTPVEAG